MIKRIFLRFIRKLKPKKRVEDHSVVVDATDLDLDLPQGISAGQDTSSDHATKPSDPPIVIATPASTQLVLWHPPTVAVPPFSFTPSIDAFRGRLSANLVQAAAALTLGFHPTIATQVLLTQHFFSSFLRSGCLERDFMLQRLQESANIAATLKYIFGGISSSQGNSAHEEPVHPAVSEIRHLVVNPSLPQLAPVHDIPSGAYPPRQHLPPPSAIPKSQSGPIEAARPQEVRYFAPDPALAYFSPIQDISSGICAPQPSSTHLHPAAKQQTKLGRIRYLAADPAFAHLAPKQIIPPGAFGPRQPVIPPAGVPSLAWSGKTAGTLKIDTPQLLLPDPLAPSKKAPRYPPGLGFPSEQVDKVANTPTTPFIPTQLLRVNGPDPSLFASNAATRGHDVHALEYDYEDANAADARFRKYNSSVNVINLQAGMYRYKLTRTIGRGAYGTVWLGEGARDDGPPMDVAIKVINRKRFFSTWVSDKELGHMSSPKGMKLLEQRLLEAGECVSGEFGAWLRISFENHPFLTPLIDCFSDKNNFYFAMVN